MTRRVPGRVTPQVFAGDREEILGLIRESSGIVFDQATVRQLMGPLVYLWLDAQDRPLYVGRSDRGISRAFLPDHHRMTAEPKTVLIYPTDRAARLEELLIRTLAPRDNRRLATGAGRLIERLALSTTAAHRFVRNLAPD